MNDKEIDLILRKSEQLVEAAFSVKARADAMVVQLGFTPENLEQELAKAFPPEILEHARRREQALVEDANRAAEALIAEKAAPITVTQPTMRRTQRFTLV